MNHLLKLLDLSKDDIPLNLYCRRLTYIDITSV